MEPNSADAELSIRRSRLRMKALIMLSSLTEAYPRQLARAIHVDSSRIHWVMHGHLPKYRPELSLIRLGLVEEVLTANGRKYVITRQGRRKARSITSFGAKRLREDAWTRRARA